MCCLGDVLGTVLAVTSRPAEGVFAVRVPCERPCPRAPRGPLSCQEPQKDPGSGPVCPGKAGVAVTDTQAGRPASGGHRTAPKGNRNLFAGDGGESSKGAVVTLVFGLEGNHLDLMYFREKWVFPKFPEYPPPPLFSPALGETEASRPGPLSVLSHKDNTSMAGTPCDRVPGGAHGQPR